MLALLPEFELAGQEIQALDWEMPANVPAGQGWQAESVSPLKNVPGGQHTDTPSMVQCLTVPVEQLPGQAMNTRGVPELYRAMASASVIA